MGVEKPQSCTDLPPVQDAFSGRPWRRSWSSAAPTVARTAGTPGRWRGAPERRHTSGLIYRERRRQIKEPHTHRKQAKAKSNNPERFLAIWYLRSTKAFPSVGPAATLTWSCCSWTPSRGIRHGWGTGNRGCWRCRRFPGSTAGPQRRASPCWGSGLRESRNIYVSRFVPAGRESKRKRFWYVAGQRLLSHTRAGGTEGSLSSATPGPWTGRPATWSPRRNASGWREIWWLTRPEPPRWLCKSTGGLLWNSALRCDRICRFFFFVCVFCLLFIPSKGLKVPYCAKFFYMVFILNWVLKLPHRIQKSFLKFQVNCIFSHVFTARMDF